MLHLDQFQRAASGPCSRSRLVKGKSTPLELIEVQASFQCGGVSPTLAATTQRLPCISEGIPRAAAGFEAPPSGQQSALLAQRCRCFGGRYASGLERHLQLDTK